MLYHLLLPHKFALSLIDPNRKIMPASSCPSSNALPLSLVVLFPQSTDCLSIGISWCHYLHHITGHAHKFRIGLIFFQEISCTCISVLQYCNARKHQSMQKLESKTATLVLSYFLFCLATYYLYLAWGALQGLILMIDHAHAITQEGKGVCSSTITYLTSFDI